MYIVSTVIPFSERNLPKPPGSRVSMLVAIGGSLLIHTLVFLSLARFTPLPSVDFQIELPAEVEFGLTEESKMETPPAKDPLAAGVKPVSTAALVEPDSKQPTATLETVDREKKREKRAKRRDAVDERTKRGETEKDGGVSDDSEQNDAGTSVLAAYAPPGTQLALRLDMDRVRSSPLAAEVRKLLEVVPDWNLILDGSGIDPVDDLNRLFIASPNLMRSRLVVAGQYQGGRKIAQTAVANLAATQGKEIRWRSQSGIAVAPWLNRDETERIVALVGPEIFTITRPNDLPRVLAVAKGLAERRAQQKEGEEDIAEALLAMENGETLSLSVEGARQFVRGRTKGVPTRLSVSVKEEAEEKEIFVTAEGLFDSVEEAQEAKAYWDKMRKRIMSHPLVALADMSLPLAEATIELDETSLVAQAVLSYKHVRVIFGFLESTLSTPQTSARPVKDKQPQRPATPNQGSLLKK